MTPHLGERGGGMLVNVSGSNFRDFGDARCRFGNNNQRTYATVRSRELMQCVTPAYPESSMFSGRQEVTLEVTLNGVDYTRSASASRFTFYSGPLIQISHLSPSGGPVRGDTRITVSGHAFEGHGARLYAALGGMPPTSRARKGPSDFSSCIWWRPNATCIPGVDCRSDCARPGPCAMKVPATYIDRQTVACTSPPALLAANTSLGNGSSALPTDAPPHSSFYLDLTLDDHTYTEANTSSFLYYEPSSVGLSHVDPIGGPSSGGTAVLLLGGGFRRLGSARYNDLLNTSDYRLDDGTHCLFGTDPFNGNATTRVPATVLSSTRLLCRSPAFTGLLAHHKMPVPVHVTINGDDWAITPSCANCNFTVSAQPHSSNSAPLTCPSLTRPSLTHASLTRPSLTRLSHTHPSQAHLSLTSL